MAKNSKLAFDVYHGDCKQVLPEKVFDGSARLAILDPPYNMGKDYEAHKDKMKVPDYLMWLQDRVLRVKKALSEFGSMWIFINDGLVSEVDMQVKALGFHKRAHVIWYYTFGVNHKSQFTPSHTHLLYYSCSRSQWTFNPDPVMHPSARQIKYKDKRANPKGRLPDNTWVLFPEQLPEGFDPMGDTWLESRVCGTFHEREKHSPNQIPVPIMSRIVLACSNKGDLVIDPFMGSGSAGVACKMHGRAYVGCDVSATCVEQSARRINDVVTSVSSRR